MKKSEIGQLNAYQPQLVGTRKSQTEDSDNCLNNDLETHPGTKRLSNFAEIAITPSNENTVIVEPV